VYVWFTVMGLTYGNGINFCQTVNVKEILVIIVTKFKGHNCQQSFPSGHSEGQW